jgi:hypothetical protein
MPVGLVPRFCRFGHSFGPRRPLDLDRVPMQPLPKSQILRTLLEVAAIMFPPFWHAYRRRFDLAYYWPNCKRRAEGNLDRARQAFLAYTVNSPAWRRLPAAEVRRITEKLS